MSLEQRIRSAEADLFSSVGVEVDESFLELANTGVRVRLLSHGNGPPLVLLHGVSLTAAAWAPLFTALSGWRVLAVDLPGHGLSDPDDFRRGQVRHRAGELIDDIYDALGLDEAPVVGHSLGGMLALWHTATGSERISRLVAIGEPAVALPGRPRPDASVASDGPWPQPRCPALTQPPRCLSTPARPGSRSVRGRRRARFLDRRAAPVGPSTRERPNRRLADARDRPLPPTASRERPHHRGAPWDPGSDDVHMGHGRPIPQRRARPTLDRPDPAGDAARSARRTRPLAGGHRPVCRAHPNPPHRMMVASADDQSAGIIRRMAARPPTPIVAPGRAQPSARLAESCGRPTVCPIPRSP